MVTRTWYKNWTGEVMQNTNYPIVVGDYAYIGTLAGKVHRIRLSDGNETCSPGGLSTWGPRAFIMHTLASDGTKIYAAAGDGKRLCPEDQRRRHRVDARQISKAALTVSPLLYDETRSTWAPARASSTPCGPAMASTGGPPSPAGRPSCPTRPPTPARWCSSTRP